MKSVAVRRNRLPAIVPAVAAVLALAAVSGPVAGQTSTRRPVQAQAKPTVAKPTAAKPTALKPAASKAEPGNGAAVKATDVASGGTSPRRYTVIVDAGHGGRDPGMTGLTSGRRRIYEKDIALAVSRRLAANLEKAGVNVVMTRTTDTLIALYDRGPIANKRQGDMFISVHVNAANPQSKNSGAVRGFETFFLAEAKTEDERRVARMENESVNFDTDVERPTDGPLAFMFNDMAQNEHLRESSDLAAMIQSRLRGPHPGPSRGVKQGGLVVLSTAFMPAVLVEIGYGTNRSDADWMASASGQEQAAAAIARAALDYLQRRERRVSGGPSGRGK